MKIEVDNVRVTFGTTVAVQDVSLTIAPGEIHAIVGENGAGKSTVMNALFGLVSPTHGAFFVDGKPRSWTTAEGAIRAGLGMVHQHFALSPSMTVLENIILADKNQRSGLARFSKTRELVEELAVKAGLDVDPDARVSDLSMGQRQRVEVLKALINAAEVLIFDEPTAVLTPEEASNLLHVLRRFRDEGKAVVLITHKMDEVRAVADTISVMRGGQLVLSGTTNELADEDVESAIVGGVVKTVERGSGHPPGPERLRIDGLALSLHDQQRARIDFALQQGEIVGIAGISGHGQSELIARLVGLAPLESGILSIENEDMTDASVARRRRKGLRYIPEDRQSTGLALDASVADNVGLFWLNQHGSGTHWLPARAFVRSASAAIDRFAIRVSGPKAAARTMSGGNRQKLVAARELDADGTIIIAENPTWGVDIGAIARIREALIAKRDSGAAILLVSTELDEILAMSDRVFVMRDGELIGPFNRNDTSREKIGRLMSSSVRRAA